MNRIKLLLAGIFALSVLSPAALLAPSVVHAQTPTPYNISQSLCNGANNVNGKTNADCDNNKNGTGEKVQGIVNTVISIFSWVVGIVSVVMIIFGGFKYITSGGDSNGVTSAKNTILFAIVGLVIVALAQIIVKFVIGTVSGVASDGGGGDNPN